MINASATAPDADRMSTSTTGLMSWTASLMKRKDAPQISPSAVNARYGRTGFLGSGTRHPLVCGKHQRDRTVVLDADTHDRSKATGRSFYSALAKTVDERFVELLGTGWIACSQEARATPATHVGKERELRHDQRRTFDINKAQVHLARLVGEDAEVDDLVGKPADRGFVVISCCTNQQHETVTNGCAVIVPAHGAGCDPLRDYPHLTSVALAAGFIPAALCL